MFEREYRELAHVPRWSTVRTIGRQSVAEHSYYVALYAMQTAGLIQWRYPGEMDRLVKDALCHDLEEFAFGDTPGPAKRYLFSKAAEDQLKIGLFQSRFHGWPITTSSNHGIREIIKFADCLDATMFLCGEYQLGNRTIGHPMDAFYVDQSNPKWRILEDNPTVCFKNGVRLTTAWRALQSFSHLPENQFKEYWVSQVLSALDREYQGQSKILEDM